MGRQDFRGGLGLALPVVTALLIVNLALGILTRAAPQLNIFAVGFPITLMVGMVSLMLSLPYFIPVMEQLVMEGLKTMLDVARTAAGNRLGIHPVLYRNPGKFFKSEAGTCLKTGRQARPATQWHGPSRKPVFR